MYRFAALALIALCFGWVPLHAAVPAPNACATGAMADIVGADPHDTPMRVALVPRFTRVPAGGPMSLVVAGETFVPASIAKYRIAVTFHLDSDDIQNFGLVEKWDVTASEVPAEFLPKSTVLPKPAQLLSFTAPEDPLIGSFSGWWWHQGTITVVGCDKAGVVQFVARMPANFSNRWTCLALTMLVTGALYVLAALAVRGRDNTLRAGPELGRFRALDPVLVSSDQDNKGSMSRLQLLFFSVLVFALLFYLLLRIGLLSDISQTVLLLLGISAVGAAASKATETAQTRLDFNNWAWLARNGWLHPNGIAYYHVARWSDLLKGSDGFDVYHFQMLIFSLAVGLALLQTGFTDLSTFEVPEKLLGVLGLTQAVYVGGKLVDPPGIQDFDAAMTELRTREAAFVEAAMKPVAVAAASPPPLSRPADLATAMARAPQEFAKYDEQVKKVRIMFQSLYREVQAVTPMPAFVYRFY